MCGVNQRWGPLNQHFCHQGGGDWIQKEIQRYRGLLENGTDAHLMHHLSKYLRDGSTASFASFKSHIMYEIFILELMAADRVKKDEKEG